MQLLVAGKAHPHDGDGKRLIEEFGAFAAGHDVRHRVIMLADYDMALARVLVSGVDVWLNTPLRPLEACGTSGMKAALNGVLNLSILDGWWDECYDPAFGWAIPSAEEDGIDAGERDAREAASILDLIEHELAPRFYERDDGLPRAWLGMIRQHGQRRSPRSCSRRACCATTSSRSTCRRPRLPGRSPRPAERPPRVSCPRLQSRPVHDAGGAMKILVAYDGSDAGGARARARAAQIAQRGDAEVTVISVVPLQASGPRSAGPVVSGDVEEHGRELDEAVAKLKEARCRGGETIEAVGHHRRVHRRRGRARQAST